ncbi:MAG: hypothetical protein V7609_1859 [Verrucomicrobiota bacterium]
MKRARESRLTPLSISVYISGMRSVLACLLCLVLSTAQTFAIKGGPNYGGAGVRTTGTYAGVMLPGPLSPGANSIGIFSVTIPKTGLGTGVVVIFTAGETYTGTFQGIADPDGGKLSGEVDASFPYLATVVSSIDANGKVTYTTESVVAKAAGKLEGQITKNKNAFSAASARLVGEADIQFSLTVNNPFTEIAYIVSGFKQAEL